jgi:TPR repeat protein
MDSSDFPADRMSCISKLKPGPSALASGGPACRLVEARKRRTFIYESIVHADARNSLAFPGSRAAAPAQTETAAQKAVRYQQGCDAGDGNGCTKLGTMFDTGDGVAQDTTQAAVLYQKGCTAGDTEGCYKLKYPGSILDSR